VHIIYLCFADLLSILPFLVVIHGLSAVSLLLALDVSHQLGGPHNLVGPALATIAAIAAAVARAAGVGFAQEVKDKVLHIVLIDGTSNGVAPLEVRLDKSI